MPASLLALVFGLGTAMCFGTGDYLAQHLTHRHGWLVAVAAVQGVAALLLGLVALTWHGAPALAQGSSWALLAGIGLVNTLGLVALYRAFEQGLLSLVSPIVGSMGAFSVIFAWIGGRPPAALLVPALVTMVLGIVCASVVVEPNSRAETESREHAPAPSKLRRARGVGWALLSAIAFGWVFFMIGPSSERLGAGWVVFALRVVALLVLFPLARALRTPLAAELAAFEPTELPRLLLVACLDCGGMLTFAYASSRPALREHIATLAVLVSSFPIITIAWARLRLREALGWWQWLGVALMLASIVWISQFE